MKNNIELQNVVWREGKYYVAQCLNVDVSSFGPTQDEALKSLVEAVELYLEGDNNFAKIEGPKLVKRHLAHA
jgi:predicted RNase H-like HicB family nuclease